MYSPNVTVLQKSDFDEKNIRIIIINFTLNDAKSEHIDQTHIYYIFQWETKIL